ncbi:MAG: hypothetical protein KGJ36_05015 [Acidobacteriota bacterium]|nr:hypothetical protein [Acidobacteriota bacterium]
MGVVKRILKRLVRSMLIAMAIAVVSRLVARLRGATAPAPVSYDEWPDVPPNTAA